jgi:maltodextrin utilization protein YvdJ
MRILRNPFFVLAALLFWTTYILEFFRIYTFPFVHAYLDDILALPVILTLVVAVQRQWIYRNPSYVLSKFQVFFAVLYVSVLFEGILPALSARYTRDSWDIPGYILGALIFYWFINRPENVPLRK